MHIQGYHYVTTLRSFPLKLHDHVRPREGGALIPKQEWGQRTPGGCWVTGLREVLLSCGRTGLCFYRAAATVLQGYAWFEVSHRLGVVGLASFLCRGTFVVLRLVTLHHVKRAVLELIFLSVRKLFTIFTLTDHTSSLLNPVNLSLDVNCVPRFPTLNPIFT